MTDTQEYPWIKHYPEGVPATINPDIYESLPDFQEKICQEYGDAPVFTSLGKTMTYKEFDEKVTAFASYLQSLPGVEQGDRVAVMMPNLLQYPICLFGIMKAGLIVVNVNPLYTARELGGQLKDSGAKVLVIIENFAKTFEKIQKDSPVEHVITTQVGDLLSAPKRLLVNFMLKKVKKMVPEFNLEHAVSFRDALAQGASRKFNPVKLDRYDIALLQYTGGTTGIAKGAMLTHRNVLANLQQTGVWISGDFKKKTEVVMTALPLYHIFSLTALCSFLQWGARMVLIANPRDMKGLVKECEKQHFTVICGVNTLFNGLLNTPGFDQVDFKMLKLTVGGGTQVQKSVAERWKEVTGGHIIEAYGLTECSPGVAANPMNTPWNGSVGFPFPSTVV